MKNRQAWIVSCLSLASVVVVVSTMVAQQPKATTRHYESPYSVKLTTPNKILMEDIERGPRGNSRSSSTIPFDDWYSDKVRTRYGAWGPPAIHYPAPDNLVGKSLTWKQERVIAVALLYQGIGYQHHHLPDWQPPAGWPWKETRAGSNGRGVDCSNFTSFVYNLALGLKPSSAIKEQAETLQIPGPGAGVITHAKRIAKPATYAELVETLHTSDLLFIRRNKVDEISHVVLWIGPVGQSPDGSPLIIDSHGDGVDDSNGASIPSGVYLRPFRERSWYYREADHAIRILTD